MTAETVNLIIGFGGVALFGLIAFAFVFVADLALKSDRKAAPPPQNDPVGRTPTGGS